MPRWTQQQLDGMVNEVGTQCSSVSVRRFQASFVRAETLLGIRTFV